MSLEDQLQESAQIVQQAFKDFEDLKRQWLNQKGSSNDFALYSDKQDLGEEENPHEESAERPNEDDGDKEQGGEIDAWRDYMHMFATGEFLGEHHDSVPPAKFSDYSQIDADDPKFASGIKLGLPGSITLHVPYAGSWMPNSEGK